MSKHSETLSELPLLRQKLLYIEHDGRDSWSGVVYLAWRIFSAAAKEPLSREWYDLVVSAWRLAASRAPFLQQQVLAETVAEIHGGAYLGPWEPMNLSAPHVTGWDATFTVLGG